LANCTQIGKACSNANQVILVAPIPRYITKKCCEDLTHTENYNCDDFEFEIVSGIETHKRLLESWGHELSLSYTLIDATELSDPAEPILRNRTTREGIPLWSNWDPVHLAPAAYRELAEAVLVTSTADNSDDTASESASVITCASHGKRLPESVITVPEVPASKRGRTGSGVKPAGWLHGQAEPRYWPAWQDNIRGRPGGRYGSARRPWTRRGARARGAGGAWRW
jgi:hypothetical protein